MENANKIKVPFIEESEALNQRVVELEQSETERKRVEAALEEAEERYRVLFNSGNDAIFVHRLTTKGATGKFIEVNDVACQRLGYSREELLELSMADISATENLGDTSTIIAKLLADKHVLFKTVHLAKDGRRIPVEINTRLFKLNGQPTVLSIARDITERKEAEKLYTTLARKSPVGVYILQDRKFIFVNPEFQKSLGFTEDELLGTDPLMRVHPDDRELVRQNAVDMLKGHHLSPYEFRVIRRNGEWLWAIETVTSIQYRGKQATLGNFMNVTERKQAEEQIRQAAEEWQTTFDSITELVSIHDTNFKLVRVNKAFADTVKMKPAELVGKTCYEVVHGTHEPVANCPHKKTMETRKAATEEFFEPQLGIHLEVSTSPICNEKGEVTACVHVARDITERKQAEEKLIITDRLASIGELASGIAHELNNPLTSVIGFSQLLLDKDIPDDVKEDVRIIYKEAQRTAEVVKNLLTFARKHAPAKQLVNINSIIEKVLGLRAYEQRVSNIQVDTRFDPDLPEIVADHFQLQQVFLNIIINAEHFMIEAHGRGTLTITTGRTGDIITISFTNDGPGIPKEDLGHLFDLFFTTKEVGEGTGLGLSICHGIVTEHGGRIYAESELGKGATFVVELPIGNH